MWVKLVTVSVLAKAMANNVAVILHGGTGGWSTNSTGPKSFRSRNVAVDAAKERVVTLRMEGENYQGKFEDVFEIEVRFVGRRIRA